MMMFILVTLLKAKIYMETDRFIKASNFSMGGMLS